MSLCRDVIIVTGSAGFIGSTLIEKLAGRFSIVGLDKAVMCETPKNIEFMCIDLTRPASVVTSLQRVRAAYGERIASVIHLAAYFDLTGKANSLYDEVTVHGTENLLHALKMFEVEQFVFVSSMLTHKACRPGGVINEDSPLASDLPYRISKIAAEHLIHAQHASMPTVYLRPAGVYDGLCHNPFLANQIARIYEENPIGHFYPGDLRTGQSFLHLEDLADAVERLIERRRDLPLEFALLLGEPDAIGYGERQAEISRLIRDEHWETRRIPKALVKAAIWLQQHALGEESFIRPWMVDIADDHYAIDITRARKLVGWEPRNSLREMLGTIIEMLKVDPFGWYRANKLDTAKIAAKGLREHK
jgi:nucleoside-diphosphate-sugar epimerase